MGRVNSQRENGPKEREKGLRPGNGGQQLQTEKAFISRHFRQTAAAGETVATIGSWRRERSRRRTLSSCFFKGLQNYIASGGC